jgi:hypothetical protein
MRKLSVRDNGMPLKGSDRHMDSFVPALQSED